MYPPSGFFCSAIVPQTALWCAVRPLHSRQDVPLDLQGGVRHLLPSLPSLLAVVSLAPSHLLPLALSLLQMRHWQLQIVTKSLLEIFPFSLFFGCLSSTRPCPTLFLCDEAPQVLPFHFIEFPGSTLILRVLLCLHHDDLLQETTACHTAEFGTLRLPHLTSSNIRQKR